MDRLPRLFYKSQSALTPPLSLGGLRRFGFFPFRRVPPRPQGRWGRLARSALFPRRLAVSPVLAGAAA